MATKTIRPCRAENPDVCPHHGTPDFHSKEYAANLGEYLGVLKTALSEKVGSKQKQLDELRTKVDDSLAHLEAHDKNYKNLVKTLKTADSSNTEEYKNLVYRKYRADEVRQKLGRETDSTKQAKSGQTALEDNYNMTAEFGTIEQFSKYGVTKDSKNLWTLYLENKENGDVEYTATAGHHDGGVGWVVTLENWADSDEEYTFGI